MHRFEGGGARGGNARSELYFANFHSKQQRDLSFVLQVLMFCHPTHFLYERPVWTLLLDFLNSAFFSRSFIKSRLNEIVPISKRPSL